MSRFVLCRICAVVVVLGGALMLSLRAVLFTATASDAYLPDAILAFLSLMWAVLAVLLTVGILGVYALPARRSWTALSGLVLVVLSLPPVAALDLALGYYSVAGYPERFDQIDTIPVEYAAWGVGLSLFALGILLLGVALARSGALGLWAALLFVLPFLTLSPISTLSQYFGLPPAPVSLIDVTQVAEGICWILLGWAVWRRAPRKEPAPAL